MTTTAPEPAGPEPDPGSGAEDEMVDEAGEESFPASDPPATWSGHDDPPATHPG